MKRRSISTLAGLALLACLAFAAPAKAAPVLSVKVDHYPGVIHKNDVFLGYKVDVKNTGPDPTAGALTVSIQLPPGLTLKRIQGTGWSCAVPYNICTHSGTIAPGGSYPTLDLDEVRIDAFAPDQPLARAVASGGGAAKVAAGEHSFTFDAPVLFKLEVTEARAVDEDEVDMDQAGSHPYMAYGIFETTKLRGWNQASGEIPMVVEDMHAGVGELPVGVVGNPEAAGAVCKFAQLNNKECPEEAAVGGVAVFASANGDNPPDLDSPRTDPVYRMAHEKGYPASFGFKTLTGLGPSFIVRAKVRSDGDFGITTLIPLVPQEPKFFGANFAFCGFGARTSEGFLGMQFDGCKKRTDADANTDAFISLATNCSDGQPLTRFAIDSWAKRGRYADNGLPDLSDPNWKEAPFLSPLDTGCELLTASWTDPEGTEPSFAMQPDSRAADSPAAYTAKLHIPQDGLTDPEGLATSHLKDTVVTLPQGLSFNPSIAHRLEGCNLKQIGYLGNDFPAPNKIRFDTKLPNCPEASKVGNAEVKTPLLADPLKGSVYLASQTDNPFGSNYAIYLSIEEEDLGVIVKLPGKIDLNPANGQITATFKDNPQLPFEDLELRFFGGDRAALANPVTCGAHQVGSSFSPWSAMDPYSPQPGEIARPQGAAQIDSGANGAPCPATPGERPFEIGFTAGASDPIAGATSPFSFRIARADGNQEIDRLQITPPKGFVASLKGVPYCSEAQIEAAGEGSGKAQQQSPYCPKASEIGSTNAGAGPGATPFYAPGKLYLSGPYKGQPLSVVAITPAVAGPYDLGNVVIRTALRIDPVTARITALTDPIPQVYAGVPLRIRDIRINLDRPNWAQNPTSCEAMSVDLVAHGSNGATADPANRFQVGGCENLAFKPRVNLRLFGGTTRAKYQGVRAVVRPRPGDANISGAVVKFPTSAFVAQEHLNNICTRVQWAADACPKSSVYGHAEAITPLLDEPLKGTVHLRSSSNLLPDLVADLRGPDHQPIKVEVAIKTDAVKGALRSTVQSAPDAPVTYFRLQTFGGDKGLIVNSRNICKGNNNARVTFRAHNGRRSVQSVPVRNARCAKQRKAAKRKAAAAKRKRMAAKRSAARGR